jgi:hypothetical protein
MLGDIDLPGAIKACSVNDILAKVLDVLLD